MQVLSSNRREDYQIALSLLLLFHSTLFTWTKIVHFDSAAIPWFGLAFRESKLQTFRAEPLAFSYTHLFQYRRQNGCPTVAPALEPALFLHPTTSGLPEPKACSSETYFPKQKRRTPRLFTTPAVLLLITVPVRHAICALPTKAQPFRLKGHVYIIGNTYF